MGHDFAGGGDFHDLVHGARVQEEGNLGAAGVDGLKGGGGFALVGEMSFGGDCLRSDAESGLEDSLVKKDDVELALERRNVGKKLVEIGAIAKGEDIEGSLGRIDGGKDADGAGRDSFRDANIAHRPGICIVV